MVASETDDLRYLATESKLRLGVSARLKQSRLASSSFFDCPTGAVVLFSGQGAYNAGWEQGLIYRR